MSDNTLTPEERYVEACEELAGERAARQAAEKERDSWGLALAQKDKAYERLMGRVGELEALLAAATEDTP